MEVANRWFPRPPSPPRATTARWPRPIRSSVGRLGSTTVPAGTRKRVVRGAVALGSLAVAAALGLECGGAGSEARSRSDGVADQHDVAAAAAVAAVGAAARNVRLPAEADAAVAAAAGLDLDLDPVVEHQPSESTRWSVRVHGRETGDVRAGGAGATAIATGLGGEQDGWKEPWRLTDPDVQWEPHVAGGRVFSSAELLAWLEPSRATAQSSTRGPTRTMAGNRVLASGSFRLTGPGGASASSDPLGVRVQR